MKKILLLIFVIASASLVSGQNDVKCEETGFFRHPDNCAKFYRCVDFGYRTLTIFHFDCPAGTIFDESLSVCNWPYAAQPPCEETKEEVEEEEEADTIIVSPTFSFECKEAGIFPHENDCKKFWLCKPDGDDGLKPAELYRCPESFLFQDEIRRCQKEDEVECTKTPDLSRTNYEPNAITLRVSEMDSFFAKWSKM